MEAGGQMEWDVFGDVEKWSVQGTHWNLNAPAAGTASLVLLPSEPSALDVGLTCRIRWRMDFSGSTANFTRLHWLLDAGQWDGVGPSHILPVSGEASDSSHADLTFMHLGESGSSDSIRWWGRSLSSDWDSMLAVPTHGHYAQGIAAELEWSQLPGADSARITLREVFENGSTSARQLMAHVPHELPAGLGFSAQFTASNTTGASIEVLEFGPYQPDTIPPRIDRASVESGAAITVRFSQPMHPTSGTVTDGETSVDIPWTLEGPHNNSARCLIPFPWPTAQGRALSFSGFTDDAGNVILDTTVFVFQLDSAQSNNLVISEFMVQSAEEDDWVEIANTSTSGISMATVRWWDGSTSTTGAIQPLWGWDGVLGPNERAVLVNAWEPWMAAHPIGQFGRIETGLSLHHAGEAIGLCNSDGLPIDEVDYEGSWWPAGTETKHAQRRLLKGCNQTANWAVLTAATPGIPSAAEWPLDSVVELAPIQSEALASGTGFTQFNQPLEEVVRPVIKGGWCWQGNAPNVLHWRIDSLRENSTWQVEMLGAKGCFDDRVRSHKVVLDVVHFPGDGDLIITEIAHDPEGPSEVHGTFVELFNPSSETTYALGGLHINDLPTGLLETLAPGARICIPWDLKAESDCVHLTDHHGFIVDAVNYSRCWHRDRAKAHAGFSLVRLQPLKGRVHPSDGHAWDSSSDASGCSFGQPDDGEKTPFHWTDSPPIACGHADGDPILLFPGPVHLNLPGAYAAEGFPPGTAWWISPGDEALFSEVCPTHAPPSSPPQALLNEVRPLVSRGSEPFIELINPSESWITTRGLHWTSTELPFPDDWQPVQEDLDWYLPPGTAVAFAECPNRIHGDRVLPSVSLPSLWGNVSLQLAHDEAFLDAVLLDPSTFAPWHAAHHSMERTGTHPASAWNSAVNAAGHTAGQLNSWARDPGTTSNYEGLAVINDTWTTANGSIEPISFEIHAPDGDTWAFQWHILSALGNVIVAPSSTPVSVQGNDVHVLHWDGRTGATIAPPGPYLLVVEFERIRDQQQHTVIASVHIASG